MGSNFTDYLKEAHRTLKLDGSLHIYESTSRFADREQFILSASFFLNVTGVTKTPYFTGSSLLSFLK